MIGRLLHPLADDYLWRLRRAGRHLPPERLSGTPAPDDSACVDAGATPNAPCQEPAGQLSLPLVPGQMFDLSPADLKPIQAWG